MELITTLRNLLGGHHCPVGEPDDSRQDYFSSNSYSRSPRDWFARTEAEKARWTDDYFFMPLGFSRPPHVEYRKEAGG